MDSQLWNWRLSPGSNLGDALTPTPSLMWVGANATPPSSSHPFNILTGAVLTHPSITVSHIRVRLFQEISVRRDASRRRVRSSPCQSAVSCQWAGTVTLGTGVHKGGVVADINLVDVNAVSSMSNDPSGVRQWMFGERLPEDLARTWTWAACEGDRKKIWYLDTRYRVIAEAFQGDRLVAAARSFVTFCPRSTTFDSPCARVGRSRVASASRALPSNLPSYTPAEFIEDFEDGVPGAAKTSSECDTRNSAETGSAMQIDRLHAYGEHVCDSPRRTVMAFPRSPQVDDIPKRPRRIENKTVSYKRQSISLIGTHPDSERQSNVRAVEALTSAQLSPPPRAWSQMASRKSFKSTEEFDDMSVTTTLHVPSQPSHPNLHAQFKLSEQVTATIHLVPKVSLSQLKVTAVLTEVIEIVDDSGARQVYVQHHHRMGVTPLPMTASRRQDINCTAQMVAADMLLSVDGSSDFMRVTHRLDVSVSFERRRILGSLLFGEETPAEHDLWDIMDGAGLKVIASTPLCLRHGEKPEQQATVPCLAVWGSTERIAAVGKSESKGPRRRPGWATSDGEESQEHEIVSKIDALRSLAYANSGNRRREDSPDGRVEEESRQFPTFKVDENSPLAKQSCPVCLEHLDGVVTMLPCLHAGHRGCIGRSQSRASVCPVCRLDLSPYVEGEMSATNIEVV